MTVKTRRSVEQRRREVALLEAQANMELLEELRRRRAPARVQRELLASIERSMA